MILRRIRLIFSAAVWGLFLLSFISKGYRWTPLLPDTSMEMRLAGSQYLTTDSYLEVLKVPHPSEYIQTVLSGLPSRDPILFIGSDDDATFQSRYFVISYLSLPRQVYMVGCRKPDHQHDRVRWAQ